MTNDEAIKALEQQPCDDCISRKDLIKQYANSFVSAYGVEVAEMFVSVVNQMPSVKPQPKIDEIIKRIEEARDKDQIAEYPYNRCIKIIREVLGDD